MADAKARFSELIDRALSEGPQQITRRGHDAVVVVSADEWRRREVQKGTLAEFFDRSPLRDSGLVIERSSKPSREVKL